MSANLVAIWDSVVASLKETIPDSSYLTWLAEARPLALEDTSLAIGVPDSFTKSGIESRYRTEIERLVTDTCKRPISLEISVLPAEFRGSASARRLRETASSVPQGGFPLNVDYTFE